MRIVDRQAFLALPSPTVYIKIPQRWLCDGTLCIKIGNTANSGDWFYQTLNDPEGGAVDSGDQFACLDAMIDRGVSYPIDQESTYRDGCFDDTELFLVYEKADVEFLVEALKEVHGRSK